MDNPTKMQPLKTEFPDFVQFSQNIDARLLDFQIKQAYTKDLKPKFGDVLIAIYENADVDLATFITNEPELGTFYRDFVLEYWILVSYKRFIAAHGLNVTQFGLTKTADPEGTFEQATGDERAVMLRQIAHDISVCETEIFKKLKEVEWTFDGEVYEIPDAKRITNKKSFGIHAIGADCDTDEERKRDLYGDFR